jgi:hypothetical protein
MRGIRRKNTLEAVERKARNRSKLAETTESQRLTFSLPSLFDPALFLFIFCCFLPPFLILSDARSYQQFVNGRSVRFLWREKVFRDIFV